ncbi:hypothetical protein SO802_030347 [Lithocarpus litseifolius]|uniref:Uncharacterized protein n=1 Tax=Lithocarpus litseifolius TaxID=425828 RepID=A0AAW2BH82_9ROSI
MTELIGKLRDEGDEGADRNPYLTTYLPPPNNPSEPKLSLTLLLAEDPALKRFKSHKKSVNAVKRMEDVLTLVVVAASSQRSD